MNHVACWLWYYETCEEFDRRVCQGPRRPAAHIWVMVPPHLQVHLRGACAWRSSERALVSLNSRLRLNIMPWEVRTNREAKREALDLHETLQHLPKEKRDEEFRRLVPGYETVAPELELIIHPQASILQLPTFTPETP